MRNLEGRVAVVTGGTFGVGRGIASVLAQCGARVFVTGRSAHDGVANDEQITGIRCDHRVDAEVTAAFDRIARKTGKVDILVNNVWGGYERMVENGTFTWTKPFWEQPLWRWDAMFSAGVRAHYHASQLVAESMVVRQRGLIVNISFWAAQKHIANVAYGVAKAATEKMTADMAVELRPQGVTVVSLYPGLVRTEKVMERQPGSTSPIQSPPSSLDVPWRRLRQIPMSCGTPGPCWWPLALRRSTGLRTLMVRLLAP